MIITEEFLNNYALRDEIDFIKSNKLLGLEDVDVIAKLVELDKIYWANWLLVNVLSHLDKVRYAVYAAEQVLGIFEKEYRVVGHPRWALGATKRYIRMPTQDAARAAAVAAFAASQLGRELNAAGAFRASDAAYAAASAAKVANAGEPASAYAADASEYAAAASADNDETLRKFIQYGIKLIKN